MKEKQIGENKYRVIKADYELGGYNYFTYKTDPRGYRVYLNTIERNGIITTRAPMNDNENLKVFVKEAKRYSKNTLAKIDKWVNEHADDIFTIWDQDGIKAAAQYILNNFKN